MIPRWFLAGLVLALPILLVTFAVVMGGFALVQALGDQAGARALLWVAAAALLALIVDLVLLVAVLGIAALGDAPERERDDRPRDSS
jgi:hypothetical protein